jgi:hypothetical protein
LVAKLRSGICWITQSCSAWSASDWFCCRHLFNLFLFFIIIYNVY